MKRVLKVIGGFVAVVAATCVLSGSAQARTTVSVNLGFPLRLPVLFGPAFHSTDNCYPSAYSRRGYYCERPAYRYYCAPPVYRSYGRSHYCR